MTEKTLEPPSAGRRVEPLVGPALIAALQRFVAEEVCPVNDGCVHGFVSGAHTGWGWARNRVDQLLKRHTTRDVHNGRVDSSVNLSGASVRETAFRDAIAAVCREHGAELEVTDDGKPYGMQQGILRVSMPSVFDGEKCVQAFCEFDW